MCTERLSLFGSPRGTRPLEFLSKAGAWGQLGRSPAEQGGLKSCCDHLFPATPRKCPMLPHITLGGVTLWAVLTILGMHRGQDVRLLSWLKEREAGTGQPASHTICPLYHSFIPLVPHHCAKCWTHNKAWGGNGAGHRDRNRWSGPWLVSVSLSTASAKPPDWDMAQ